MNTSNDHRLVSLMPIRAPESRKPSNAENSHIWVVGILDLSDQSGDARKFEHEQVYHEITGPEDGDALYVAVQEFFNIMRDTGLSGVLDAGEARIQRDSPLDFCNALTSHIHDDLPDVDAEDFQDDDFDAHPLAMLREFMVEHCPEFSGEPVNLSPM